MDGRAIEDDGDESSRSSRRTGDFTFRAVYTTTTRSPRRPSHSLIRETRSKARRGQSARSLTGQMPLERPLPRCIEQNVGKLSRQIVAFERQMSRAQCIGISGSAERSYLLSNDPQSSSNDPRLSGPLMIRVCFQSAATRAMFEALFNPKKNGARADAGGNGHQQKARDA